MVNSVRLPVVINQLHAVRNRLAHHIISSVTETSHSGLGLLKLVPYNIRPQVRDWAEAFSVLLVEIRFEVLEQTNRCEYPSLAGRCEI